MNFYSKIFSGLFLFFAFSFTVEALEINALYTSACQRIVGVVLGVENNDLFVLSLEGKIERLKRYDIVVWSTYISDALPLNASVQMEEAQRFKIYSRTQNELGLLVDGWPISYSQSKMSFLSTAGIEVVVDRRSIWKIETVTSNKAVQFKHPPVRTLFVHPYAFRTCNPNWLGEGTLSREVYPQQILSDPVAIKNKFDQWVAGYDRLMRYNREQIFYGVPQYYKNRTSVGLWMNFGSRYGAGGTRTNNFTPLLVDDRSSDVFSYQHRLSTGSGPLPTLFHEESQAHIYYQMKASYFHLTMQVDPNLLLVGENFEWKQENFTDVDDRVTDMALIELGFDYGSFAISVTPTHSYNLGVYDGTGFAGYKSNLSQLGISYRGVNFSGNLTTRLGNEEDSANSSKGKLTFTRLNLETDIFPPLHLEYSLILRSAKSAGLVNYESQTISNSFRASREIMKRVSAYSLLGYELQSIKTPKSVTNSYIKLGLGISLSF